MSSGTAGGNTTISVRVTYEQSHRPAAGMRVELIPTSGGMADIRTTDGNGATTFTGVTGRFKLRVTGPDIDRDQQTVYVRKAFDRLARLGTQIVVFGSGGARRVPDGFSKDDALKQLVDFGRRAAFLATVAFVIAIGAWAANNFSRVHRFIAS